MTDLGLPPGTNGAHASNINNKGQIIGDSYIVGQWGTQRIFLWDPSKPAGQEFQNLGTPNGYDTHALGINEQCQITGVYWPDYAYIWEASSGFRDLFPSGAYYPNYGFSINNLGQVVGFHSGYWAIPYIMDPVAGLTDLEKLGGGWCTAYAINDNSIAVGFSHASDGTLHAVVWDQSQPPGSRLKDLGPGAAFSINNKGQIVGSSKGMYAYGQAPPSGSRAMVYDPASPNPAWQDLNSMVVNLPPGVVLPHACDINNLGQIVGYTADYKAFLLNPFIQVAIDIKPGNFPNSINLGSEGKVPVAIFSTGDFDATQVDPTSVTLAGASVAIKGKGTPMASWQDLNGDGLLDLVVHVDTQTFQLTAGDTEAVLEGKTYGGLCIRGTDTVRIVP